MELKYVAVQTSGDIMWEIKLSDGAGTDEASSSEQGAYDQCNCIHSAYFKFLRWTTSPAAACNHLAAKTTSNLHKWKRSTLSLRLRGNAGGFAITQQKEPALPNQPAKVAMMPTTKGNSDHTANQW